MTAPVKRKLAALAVDAVFIALLLIGTSRTLYASAVSEILLALYLAFIAVLSVFWLWDWVAEHWRRDPSCFTRKYWRWITDDYPDTTAASAGRR